VKDHFRNNPNVVIAEGKGAQGLKHNGKMFAMFYKGDLTVKLNPETVKKVIETGEALPHDPGTGKPMKDRVLIPASQKDRWIDMCELSLRDVS
ncbi:MAG: hypothetical protein AAF485_03385, partial [Chloroflexota bacterium]